MAEPKYLPAKQPDGDEVERSIELLDKVLSEFEDPESLPPIEPDSPSQGHQSEDDGYMSMNGKKTSALNIIEVDGINVKNKKQIADAKIRNDILKAVDGTDPVPLQTTLPKARPSNVIPSKYASLPCSTPPRLSHYNTGENFLPGGRTVLGIGISAVHDAVLRGIARMPEPIVNEFPCTIYPGRASPTKKVPPRTLPGLIERHRDVCRNSIDSSQELPPPPQDNLGSKNSVNLDSSLEFEDQSIRSIIIRSPTSPQLSSLPHSTYNSTITIEACAKSPRSRKSDDEDFSDDSLEGTSLPPPPPPPFVPPQPSLSAPVTPSKRGSIAWEINLDENDDIRNTKAPKEFAATNITSSQLSIASTPGSITSTDQTCSSDWPDPPEPPICSTEDEAGSIVTDSDDVIPQPPPNMVANGTYVIRKGRKERQRLFDIESFQTFTPPDINAPKEEEDDEDSDEKPEAAATVLSFRHSIDLAIPTPALYPPHSPRARLSLNLNLPTSEHDGWAFNNASNSILASTSPRHTEYKLFCSKLDGLQSFDEMNSKENVDTITKTDQNAPISNCINNDNNVLLMRVPSLPTITAPSAPPGEILTTPRRELAPPIEEDEEQDSETQREAPLRQIENNISALLRGDIAVARVGDIAPPRRPVGFRAGVHKSESAKEMLLSQTIFGPLPPSPPSSSPDETDGFPPLPPSPLEANGDSFDDILKTDSQVFKLPSQSRGILDGRYRDTLDHPPVIPPHRGPPPTLNTLKTRSMDAGFTKCYKSNHMTMSPHAPGTLPQDFPGSANSRRRIMSGAFPKRSAQSPREERRLQTSCSLPETPIFARGCDVPRTPHRRTQELPGTTGCSRTAPRQPNGLNSSIIGIAGSTLNGRQPNRSINHALASSEMLRMTGGPARGWYPKQRQPRPASTENLDRIHPQGSIRAWDTGTAGSRKPLTLPPNLSPNFFNKSPREALRRVTSLLIRKGKESGKENAKKEKEVFPGPAHRSFDAGAQNQPTAQKKKGFFKSFWKKSKHYSLDQ